MTASTAGKFVVPFEVFERLGPIEKIVIRRQAERGEIVIEREPERVAA